MWNSSEQNFRIKNEQIALTVKKFRDTGTVRDRRRGSDRPQSACTDNNIDHVNDMILSQEDQPRTHSTVHEISRKIDIPKSSAFRIIRKDLELKCFD